MHEVIPVGVDAKERPSEAIHHWSDTSMEHLGPRPLVLHKRKNTTGCLWSFGLAGEWFIPRGHFNPIEQGTLCCPAVELLEPDFKKLDTHTRDEGPQIDTL